MQLDQLAVEEIRHEALNVLLRRLNDMAQVYPMSTPESDAAFTQLRQEMLGLRENER